MEGDSSREIGEEGASVLGAARGMNCGFLTTGDGVSIRYGVRRAGEPRGTVVLLGGRKEFAEKYRETVEELVSRGYDVHTMDWRGQGLSSRLLENPHKGHVEDFDHYVADLRCFMEDRVPARDRGPVILLAHSMGGHIALRYLREAPERVDGAVLSAPMVDIDTRPMPRGMARLITRLAVRTGRGEAYAIGSRDYDSGALRFEKNPLTSDPERFGDEGREIRENPDLALGGVTYGWLHEAFRSIDRLAAPGFAEGIGTPVLLVNAAEDTVVDGQAQRRLCRRLQAGQFLSIDGARHEILKERDEIRDAFWEAFDSFSSTL